MDFFNGFNASQNYLDVPPEALEFGDPTPPAEKRSGACLVIGTHPCWADDVSKALEQYPDADLCGVNEAGRLTELDHLATCHGEKIDQFMAHCEGQINLPLVHFRDNDVKPDSLPYAHHSWPVRTMAGSAPFAAAAMVMLGYDIVIFCGCPMDGGGGYAFKDTHKSTRDDPRIGFEDGKHRMIKSWHRCMRLFKEKYPEQAARIRSMSGVTQEIFGGLDGQL
ncbi:MAG: hypothetical protein ACPGQQ_00810 [Candidatus Puniceispirillaceae bacterium]